MLTIKTRDWEHKVKNMYRITAVCDGETYTLCKDVENTYGWHLMVVEKWCKESGTSTLDRLIIKADPNEDKTGYVFTLYARSELSL